MILHAVHQNPGVRVLVLFVKCALEFMLRGITFCVLSGTEGRCSDWQRLRVVSDGLVEVLQLKSLVSALGHLADDPGGLAGDDAEAGDDHVGGHDGAIENANVILDDGELADDDSSANMYVASDGGGLDHRPLANEDLVAQPEWKVSERPMQAKRYISICSITKRQIGLETSQNR